MSTKTSRKSERNVLATTFGEHIRELRTRLMLVGLVFFVLSIVAYSVRNQLVDIVRQPLGDQTLVYLTPAGGFSFIFSVTMYAALVVTAPYLIYQIYQFVKPTLPVNARRYSLPVFVVSILLMLAGVLFGYFVAVPAALNFLANFAGDLVIPNLTADSYLGFFMAYVAGLGLLFQLPLLLLFWNWIKPITPMQLLNSERFVIAGAFIVSAIITPTPDAFNQAMVAGPIILIYQFGAVAVLIINKSSKRKIARAQSSQKATRAVANEPSLKPVTQSTSTHRPTTKPSHTQAIAPTNQRKTQPRRAVMDVTGPVHRQARHQIPNRPLPSRSTHRSLDGISRPLRNS